MQETMKPIETKYNGYRFRSRLEARWAVFFDECGIKYEYEPEGYDLDGEWYLPDFYLPEFKLYVEIKPDCLLTDPGEKKKRDECEDKCYAFRDLVDHAIVILYGEPALQNFGKLFAWELYDYKVKISEYDTTFVWDSANGTRLFAFDSYELGVTVGSKTTKVFSKQHIDCSTESQRDYLEREYMKKINSGPLYRAMIKARQARFEYGETPRGKRR